MSRYKMLLIVDLQKEFADIKNGLNDYNKALEFVKENGNFGSYDKIISLSFKNDGNDNFWKNLNYRECKDGDLNSLEYLKYIDKSLLTTITKNGYGDNSNTLVNTIKDYKNSVSGEDIEIHIIGCDLDACIMAVCFQLWDANIDFKVLTEYCYTTAKDFTKDDVIKIMKRNFGDCIIETDLLSDDFSMKCFT